MTSGVWYTQRDGAVYAIVLDWPDTDILQLGSVTLAADSKVFMLGCEDPIKVGALDLHFSPITQYWDMLSGKEVKIVLKISLALPHQGRL